MSSTMSLDTIVKEYDRIKKRKRQSRQTADAALADIERALTRCKNEAAARGAVPTDAVKDAIKTIDSNATAIKKANKEVTSAMNKCGKAIDKVLEPNIAKIGNGDTFQGSEDLDREITDHFLRQGRWSIGETFMKVYCLGFPYAIIPCRIYTGMPRRLISEFDMLCSP